MDFLHLPEVAITQNLGSTPWEHQQIYQFKSSCSSFFVWKVYVANSINKYNLFLSTYKPYKFWCDFSYKSYEFLFEKIKLLSSELEDRTFNSVQSSINKIQTYGNSWLE